MAFATDVKCHRLSDARSGTGFHRSDKAYHDCDCGTGWRAPRIHQRDAGDTPERHRRRLTGHSRVASRVRSRWLLACALLELRSRCIAQPEDRFAVSHAFRYGARELLTRYRDLVSTTTAPNAPPRRTAGAHQVARRPAVPDRQLGSRTRAPDHSACPPAG